MGEKQLLLSACMSHRHSRLSAITCNTSQHSLIKASMLSWRLCVVFSCWLTHWWITDMLLTVLCNGSEHLHECLFQKKTICKLSRRRQFVRSAFKAPVAHLINLHLSHLSVEMPRFSRAYHARPLKRIFLARARLREVWEMSKYSRWATPKSKFSAAIFSQPRDSIHPRHEISWGMLLN